MLLRKLGEGRSKGRKGGRYRCEGSYLFAFVCQGLGRTPELGLVERTAVMQGSSRAKENSLPVCTALVRLQKLPTSSASLNPKDGL